MTYEHKLIKSRDIPLSDLFTLLQMEYIGYYLRKKIYKRDIDKKKFDDICKMKKEKIDNISRKNCLPSIFNSQERKEKYFSEFLNEWGVPNFYYRDDHQKRVKGLWDTVYYFNRGSSVKVKINGNIEVGEVINVNVKENSAMIEINKKGLIVDLGNIGRIFSNTFFDDFE